MPLNLSRRSELRAATVPSPPQTPTRTEDLRDRGSTGRDLTVVEDELLALFEARVLRFWTDHPEIAKGLYQVSNAAVIASVDPLTRCGGNKYVLVPRLSLQVAEGVEGRAFEEEAAIREVFADVGPVIEAIRSQHREIVDEAIASHPMRVKAGPTSKFTMAAYLYPEVNWPLPYPGWQTASQPRIPNLRIGDHVDSEPTLLSIAGRQIDGLKAGLVQAAGSSIQTFYGSKYGVPFDLPRKATLHSVSVPFDSARLVLGVAEYIGIERDFPARRSFHDQGGVPPVGM